MPKIIKKNRDINEFESSDDSDYMRELDIELQELAIGKESEENDYSVVQTINKKRKRNYSTDPGPSNRALILDSDSDEEISVPVRAPRTFRVYSSSDESDFRSRTSPIVNISPPWKNVTNNDNYDPDIIFSIGQNSPGPQIPLSCSTPLQFFMLFFTEELIKKLASETNKYAANIIATKALQKESIWKNWSDVTEVEMKAFLGVIINMGLIEVADMKDYWSRAFHSRIPFFGKIFTRRRFLQIFWSLHLETNPQSGQTVRTRIQKVNNYLTYLDGKFRQHFIPDMNISVDESTVGFKGRISFLAYNPKKPTKWGLRVYVMADSKTSYIYSFVPYYGKITTDDLVRPDLSFTSRIVLQLYQNLQHSVPEAAGYHIFTDRFYTNLILANELLNQKCYLSGTIMTNKRGLPENIKKPKLAKGEQIALRKKNILVLAWLDQRVVTMLSTFSNSSRTAVTRRPRVRRAVRQNIRSSLTPLATTRKNEEVKKPSVIVNYNKHMGGVDVADQYISSYCFIRKTLKWWRKLFFWGFEVSIINAYILHKTCAIKEGKKPMNHRTFRTELLLSLIGDFRAPNKKPGRVSTADKEQRLDNKPHFIYANPEGKHKDCLVCSNRKIPGGRKETNYICVTCTRKPGLHLGQCFERYHTLSDYKM